MKVMHPGQCIQPRLAMLGLCVLFSVSSLAATQQGMSYGSGTLTLANGTYQFSPQGCTHNGNRAVCSFSVTNSGSQQGNVNAWANYFNRWTMNIQLVDNYHVPHSPDTAYFVDASGAHQPVMFMQQGTQLSMSVEFPNVDPGVTGGEFHMANQIVGNIAIGQPGQAGTTQAATPVLASNQAPATATATATAGTTSSAQTTTATQTQPAAQLNCKPGTQGYSGATLCNIQAKKDQAKSWKDMLKSITN